jgi:hypothetical protein
MKHEARPVFEGVQILGLITGWFVLQSPVLPASPIAGDDEAVIWPQFFVFMAFLSVVIVYPRRLVDNAGGVDIALPLFSGEHPGDNPFN